ncbi:helix-turn-helix domain-containing protein [Paenibacillus azoreducens]|uniref:helix-turn-helix domain-containing protein n=1 Tax=Paenibacillus azoreducens TaxID=116718 RepID=UPI0039F5915E
MTRSIGKRIAKKREEKGWSRYKLAKESGVSTSYIRPIEEDRHSPSLDVLIKISTVLDVSIDYLVEESKVTITESGGNL